MHGFNLTFDSPLVMWGLFMVACFVGGFGYSWVRQRRRIMQRYQQAVQDELVKRIQQEVLRRLVQGEGVERGDATDAAGNSDSRLTACAKTSDRREQ